MVKVTGRKPDVHVKTGKATVQIRKNPDGSLTTTGGVAGGKGKGKAGGRFKFKKTVG